MVSPALSDPDNLFISTGVFSSAMSEVLFDLAHEKERFVLIRMNPNRVHRLSQIHTNFGMVQVWGDP